MRGGHAFYSLVLAERSRRADVAADTRDERPHANIQVQPAVIAQAFATMGALFPGRIFLVSVRVKRSTRWRWPVWSGRTSERLRLREAVRLIRILWKEDQVSFEGEFYQTSNATIYDRPESGVPIYIAAGGPP